jgi:hypothetical protein
MLLFTLLTTTVFAFPNSTDCNNSSHPLHFVSITPNVTTIKSKKPFTVTYVYNSTQGLYDPKLTLTVTLNNGYLETVLFNLTTPAQWQLPNLFYTISQDFASTDFPKAGNYSVKGSVYYNHGILVGCFTSNFTAG